MNPEDQTQEKKGKSNQAVMTYLFILMAAAFALLLMSYFMQQRSNEDQLEDMAASSSSAVESLQQIIAERDKLKEELATAQDNQAQLEETISVAQGDVLALEGQLEAQTVQMEALLTLSHLYELYSQEELELALDYVQTIDQTALEAQLALISQNMTTAQREVYDPLQVYGVVMGWMLETESST